MKNESTKELGLEGRQKILAAALDLLTRGGREALTTRAVAAAAGVQAPMIYRYFGDKQGLLEAVAEHGFETYLRRKHVDAEGSDAVENLRIGWDLHVEFGLANPAIFSAMYGEPRPGRRSTASSRALSMLHDRMQSLARVGRLRVDERRAADMIRAAACGVVFILLEQPEGARDLGLSHATRDAVIAAITIDRDTIPDVGLAPLAATLRARLPEQALLSGAERGMLSEWLGRIVQAGASA